jgi:hypothetical protein
MIRRNPIFCSKRRLYFGQKFAEPFTISAEPIQLQSSSYAPSIRLVSAKSRRIFALRITQRVFGSALEGTSKNPVYDSTKFNFTH